MTANISSIYLGNFADVETDESNSSAENPADLLGSDGTTRDHGPQPRRWISTRPLRFERTPRKQKPWEIKLGSMGIILLKGPDLRAQTGGSPQAIASIKSLARLRGVRQMNRKLRDAKSTSTARPPSYERRALKTAISCNLLLHAKLGYTGRPRPQR